MAIDNSKSGLTEALGADNTPVLKNQGQVVQVARGNLIGKLTNGGPLGHGELFVHCVESKSGANAKVGDVLVTDLVTGTEMPLISKGDIFMGANSTTEVYRIGGGGSLKWGGVLFGKNTSEEIDEELKSKPDTIYLWNGTDTFNIYKGTNQPEKVDRELNSLKNESQDSIKTITLNPGDLVFYSSAIQQVVYLPMNRATWDTTLTTSEGVDSDWLKEVLAQLNESGDNPKTSSLTDYINNVANHYQYLFASEGWKDITTVGTLVAKAGDATLSGPSKNLITSLENIASELTHPGTVILTETEQLLKEAISKGEELRVELTVTTPVSECPEGAIYFTPQIPIAGSLILPKGWKINSGDTDLAANTKLLPGDLVVTVTKENRAGERVNKVIPLGSQISKSIAGNEEPPTIERVEEYAKLLWKEEDELFRTVNKTNLKAYIEYLFKTKVDIDPETNKIISSQLPDFLLGALKYMGTFTHFVTSKDWSGSGFNYLGGLSKVDSGKWENLDNNEDKTATDSTSGEAGTNYDTQIQKGCYWIYNGSSPISLTKSDAESYYINFIPRGAGNGASREEESSDLITSSGNHWDTDEFTENITSGAPVNWEYLNDSEDSDLNVMVINRGDWLVWNGEKYDVISQSSGFVGIQVEYQYNLHRDIVRLLHSDRKFRKWDFKSGTEDDKGLGATEVRLEDTPEGIRFQAPNSVLFKADGYTFTHHNYIPVITEDGIAQNSRFEIGDNSDYIGFEKGDDEFNKIWFNKIPRGDLFNIGYTELLRTLRDKTGALYNPLIDYNSGTFDFNPNKDPEDGDLSIDWFDASKANYFWEDVRGEKDYVELYLPQGSGTIATQEWASLGFATTKALIRDSVQALEDKVTGGHEDWLQTIKETEEGKKEFVDSRVKQISKDSDEEYSLELYRSTTEVPEEDGNGLTENKSNDKIKITTKTEIAGNVDYKLGSKTLNPSKNTEEVELILPNHSGTLLNNNSVIDGGFWE